MTQMLSYHDIQEAAHVKLEALRDEAKRHREAVHTPISLRDLLLSSLKYTTRRTLENSSAPTLPSSSANRL
jgi:hypothetical protein